MSSNLAFIAYWDNSTFLFYPLKSASCILKDEVRYNKYWLTKEQFKFSIISLFILLTLLSFNYYGILLFNLLRMCTDTMKTSYMT